MCTSRLKGNGEDPPGSHLDPVDYWREPSPEDFEPAPPPPRSPFETMPAGRYAFLPAVFVMAFVAISLTGWNHLFDRGFWVSGASLMQGEYWRTITALFAHRDFLHLLSNAPLFMIFGFLLNAFFGTGAFLTASIGLGALTNILTVLAYDPRIRLLGASGMVYALAAFWMALYYRNEKHKSRLSKISRCTAFTLIVLFPTSFEPTTSYLAHAIGYGLGILTGIFLSKWIPLRS